MATNEKIVTHLEATARYLRAIPSSVEIMSSRFFDPDFRTDVHGQPLVSSPLLLPAIELLLQPQVLPVAKRIKEGNLDSFKSYSIETNMSQIREVLLEEIRRLFLNDDGTIKQEYIDAFAYEQDGQHISGEEAIKSQFSGVTIAAEGLPEISTEEESVRKFGYCLMNSYLSHCEQYLSECVSKEIGANEAHLPALNVWHMKEARQRQVLIDHYNTDRLSSKKEPKKTSIRTRIPSLFSLSPFSSAAESANHSLPRSALRDPKKKRRPKAASAPASLAAGRKRVQFADTVAEVAVYTKNAVEEQKVQDSKGIERVDKDKDILRRLPTKYKTGEKGISQANPLTIAPEKLKDSNKAHDLANDIEEYDPKTLMPSFRRNFRGVGRNFTSKHIAINHTLNDEIQAICDDVNGSFSLFGMFENAMREDNLASLEMVTLYQLREKFKELHEKISVLNTKTRPEYDNKPLDWALFELSLDILMRMDRIVYEGIRNRLIKNGMEEGQIEALFQQTEDGFFSAIINQYVPPDSIEVDSFLATLNRCKKEEIISARQYVFILEKSDRDQKVKEQFIAIMERKGIIDPHRVASAFINSLELAPKETELRQKLVDSFTQQMLNEDDFIRGCTYLNRPKLVEAIVFSSQATAEEQKNKILSSFNEGKITEGKCVFIYKKIQQNIKVVEAFIKAVGKRGHDDLLDKLVQKEISDQEYCVVCDQLFRGTTDSVESMIEKYRKNELQKISIDSIPEIESDAKKSFAVGREHLRTVIGATNPNPYSEPNSRAFVDPFMSIQGFSLELQTKAREDFVDLYNSMVGFHNDDKNRELYQQDPDEYIMELCVLKQAEGKPTPETLKQRHPDLFGKMYRYIFDEQGNYTDIFRGEFSGKSVDQYLEHCNLSRQDLFLQYIQNYHDTANELFKKQAAHLDGNFEVLFHTFHTEFFGRDQVTAPNSAACDAFFCEKLKEQINQNGWLSSLDLLALFQLKKEVSGLRGMSSADKAALIFKIKMEQWNQLLALKENADLSGNPEKTLGEIASEEDEKAYLDAVMDLYFQQKPEIAGRKKLIDLFQQGSIEKEEFKFIFRQFSLNEDFALAMVNAALEGISPLHYAAREDDTELAQFLISQGKTSKSTMDDKSRTPLHYAIGQPNIEMMKLLIAEGADVNAKDFLGKTPLHYAVEQGNRGAIYFLLTQGANLSLRDNSEKTVFHYAVRRKEKAILDLLINFTDKDYKTLLHYAVVEGNLELTQSLIEQGAGVDVEDNEGKTPLDYCDRNNVKLYAYLAQIRITKFYKTFLSTVEERLREYKGAVLKLRDDIIDPESKDYAEKFSHLTQIVQYLLILENAKKRPENPDELLLKLCHHAIWVKQNFSYAEIVYCDAIFKTTVECLKSGASADLKETAEYQYIINIAKLCAMDDNDDESSDESSDESYDESYDGTDNSLLPQKSPLEELVKVTLEVDSVIQDPGFPAEQRELAYSAANGQLEKIDAPEAISNKNKPNFLESKNLVSIIFSGLFNRLIGSVKKMAGFLSGDVALYQEGETLLEKNRATIKSYKVPQDFAAVSEKLQTKVDDSKDYCSQLLVKKSREQPIQQRKPRAVVVDDEGMVLEGSVKTDAEDKENLQAGSEDDKKILDRWMTEDPSRYSEWKRKGKEKDEYRESEEDIRSIAQSNRSEPVSPPDAGPEPAVRQPETPDNFTGYSLETPPQRRRELSIPIDSTRSSAKGLHNQSATKWDSPFNFYTESRSKNAPGCGKVEPLGILPERSSVTKT